METTVLLVDDHPIFRKGLRILIENEEDIKVVGEAEDGQTAINLVRKLSPDIVVMDITMPNLNGIKACRQIISESPNAKIVTLSVHSGKRFVENMLEAGAAGYILKESAPEELVKGIRAVVDGKAYLSPSITEVALSRYRKALSGKPVSQEKPDLTEKEIEIVQLLIDGNTTEQIASVLQISTKKVNSMQKQLMKKLGVNNVAELSEVASQEVLLQGAGYHGRGNKTVVGQIVNTKLYRSEVPGDYIIRSRLIKYLDKNCNCPLILISAPAGYGKSTLVSKWLEGYDCSSAWLSLDTEDSDLATFFNYFLAAVRTQFPKKCSRSLALLRSSELPPLSLLADILINDLFEIEKRFILVLDDYGHIHNPNIDELLNQLLKHVLPNFHLFILTRRDPPLPLNTLRAKGKLKEIRQSALQFTATEISAFLQKAVNVTIDEASLSLLEEKTEGWPAGLRMLSIALRNRNDIKEFMRELKGDTRHIRDYLMAEVLSRQQPEIRDCLLKASILNRFCASLLDALFSPEIEGETFIERLDESNLFSIPLDDRRKWFRFHHLFRDLLKLSLDRRYEPDEIAALHKKASAWFDEKRLIEEALEYALKSGDNANVAHLVEKYRHDIMNQEEWPRLARWLDKISSDVIIKSLALLISKAWILLRRGRLSEVWKMMDQCDELLATRQNKSSIDRVYQGEMQVMRCFEHYVNVRAQPAESSAQDALNRLPNHYHSSRGFATLIKVLGIQMGGDLKRAREVVNEALQDEEASFASYKALLLSCRCFLDWIAADLSSLKLSAKRYMKHGKVYGLWESIAVSNYFSGIMKLERNELAPAENFLASTIKITSIPNVNYFAHSMYALSLLHQAQGRTDKAIETAESVAEYMFETDNTPLFETSMAFQAELALRQGRIAEAENWAEDYNPDPFLPAFRYYVPQLTLAKIILVRDTETDRKKAGDLLSRLYDFFSSTHCPRMLINVLALQALLHDARGEESEALTVLEHMITLAEPGGFIRPFLDPGPKMASLLSRLAKQKDATGYIGRILDAFRNETVGSAQGVTDGHAVRLSSLNNEAFVEPLTNREIEILTLLARRLSNKEVAEKLFISHETVKKHTINIYQKLYVNSRRQAVDKANKLGIISTL